MTDAINPPLCSEVIETFTNSTPLSSTHLLIVSVTTSTSTTDKRPLLKRNTLTLLISLPPHQAYQNKRAGAYTVPAPLFLPPGSTARIQLFAQPIQELQPENRQDP